MKPPPRLRARRATRARLYCEDCRRGWMGEGAMIRHLQGRLHGLTYAEAAAAVQRAKEAEAQSRIHPLPLEEVPMAVTVGAEITGRTIVDVRRLTTAESRTFGWYEPGIVLVLDDGSQVVVSRDPEGNGPGALIAYRPDGTTTTIA